MNTIKLGATYRDAITGFQGVAVGHCNYISGCSQVLLSPPVDADGKKRDGEWFDEQRCAEVEGAARIVLQNQHTPGPDAPAPKI